MNLTEAIKILNNSGFITESSEEYFFKDITDMRQTLSKLAVASHELSDSYDQYEQEPYTDNEAIDEISDETFVKWMDKNEWEDGKTIKDFVGIALDEKSWDDLIRAWKDILYGEQLIGYNYTWNN